MIPKAVSRIKLDEMKIIQNQLNRNTQLFAPAHTIERVAMFL